jgi:TPR repeat protein
VSESGSGTRPEDAIQPVEDVLQALEAAPDPQAAAVDLLMRKYDLRAAARPGGGLGLLAILRLCFAFALALVVASGATVAATLLPAAVHNTTARVWIALGLVGVLIAFASGVGLYAVRQVGEETVWRWLGRDLLLSERPEREEAERVFRQAAEAGNPASMSNLGALLNKRGDKEEAERWFRQAAEAGNADGITSLGALLEERGETEEAERLYRQAVEAGNAFGKTSLGALLEERGETEEAERWYRQAVEAETRSR